MAAEHRATATVSAGALAVVVDELDHLPRLDDRFRLWPWSLRNLARRRQCSPGTVHKHLRSLRAAGVLVDDDTSRTLVDTARLRLARSAAPHRGPSAVPAGQARILTRGSATTRQSWAADVLAAIQALTCAVEAHTAHSGVLLSTIERLARLLADDPSDESSGGAARHGVDTGARGRACGGRRQCD